MRGEFFMKNNLTQIAAIACMALSLTVQAVSDVVALNQKIALDSDGTAVLNMRCGMEAVPSHLFWAECRNKQPVSVEILLSTVSGKTFASQLDLSGEQVVRRLVLELGKDFKWLGQERLKNITWRIKGAPGGQFECDKLRIAPFSKFYGSVNYAVAVPEKPRPRAAENAVKVFFELENSDLVRNVMYQDYQKRKVLIPYYRDYQGFRSDLLEHAEGFIRSVASPTDADVIVYARNIPGGDSRIPEAVRQGKRLIVFGNPPDPAVRDLAPLSLKLLDDKTVAPRLKPVVAKDPRFPDTLRSGATAGNHYEVGKVADGSKVLLSGMPGNVPLIVEKGRVIHCVNGIGGSLIDNGPFRDLMLLRLLLRPDGKMQDALTLHKSELKRQEDDRKEAILRRCGVDPENWHVGVSDRNFGRFGWSIREGLQSGTMEANLTVSLGSQFFGFTTGGPVELPLNSWKVTKTTGDVQLPAGAERSMNPLTRWFGAGTALFEMDVTLLPEWKEKPLFFVVREGIDDTDTLFVNGKEIAKTDEKTPNYWEAPRNYRIPAESLKFGGANRLSVEVRNLRGEAGFGSLPTLQVGSAEFQPPEKLVVTDINYFSKEYTLGKGGNQWKIRMSLGTPFVRYTFPGRRSVEMASDGRSLCYGAIPQKEGIRIIDFRKNGYDLARDGGWNAPWMLLFSGSDTPSAPLLVVFEHQPAEITALSGNLQVTGFKIKGKTNLDNISAGYLFGAKKLATSGWKAELPADVIVRINRSLQSALNFPVACDEVFRIEPGTGRVIVRNVFRYAPVATDWKIRMAPYASLPPMVGFALREKLTAACEEKIRDTGVFANHGPVLGVTGKNWIEWSFDAPDHGDLHLPGITENADMEYVNTCFRKAVQRTVGGNFWYNFNGEKPMGPNEEPWFRNICLFRWLSGLGNALNCCHMLDGQNQKALLTRLEKAAVRPFDLWQYKLAADFREEPFSGLRYQVLIKSVRTLGTAFAPGHGASTMSGDCNEAVTSMLWVFEQLGNRFGRSDLILANWDSIRRAASFSLIMDDYASLSGSLSDDGVGAWIDMLNCEYAGMICYSRLGRIAGDREAEVQGLYRAARKALPTLCRFRFSGYNASLDPAKEKNPYICGFSEYKAMEAVFKDDWNFYSAHDMWDFSQGMPGPLIRLYQTYLSDDTDRYLTGEPIKELVKDDKLNLRHPYLKALAYFHKGALPLTAWGNEMKKREKNIKLYDWPGMGLGAEYGAILWRDNGQIGLTNSRNLNITKAVYDPMVRCLIIDCTASFNPELRIGSKWKPSRLLVNGCEQRVKYSGTGTIVPLLAGQNRIEVYFEK